MSEKTKTEVESAAPVELTLYEYMVLAPLQHIQEVLAQEHYQAASILLGKVLINAATFGDRLKQLVEVKSEEPKPAAVKPAEPAPKPEEKPAQPVTA